MNDIFLSYSRLDKDVALKIANALEKEGFKVWWDEDIPAGKTFNQVIEQAINEAKCIIVLWSKNSILSEWVLEEAAEGKNRNILLPILIEDVDIPLGFKRRQTCNLMNWNKKNSDPVFQKLLTDIQSIINQNSKNKEFQEHITSSQNQSTSKFSNFSSRKIIGVSIIIVGVLGALFYYNRNRSNCELIISGIVEDGANRNSGVSVQLFDEDNDFLKSLKVNETGKYEFEVDCHKNYALVASKKDYKAIRKEIVGDSGVTVLDLEVPKLKCKINFDTSSFNFDFDKTYIKPGSAVILEPIIASLTQYPDIQIKIEVHTDTRGNKNYGLNLTNLQAKSIYNYLISNGVDSIQIKQAIGYGSQFPLISDAEILNLATSSEKSRAHQQNRRVKITVLDCDTY